MDCVCASGLIRPNTSDLTSIGRVSNSSLGEGRSIDVERVVTTRENEISNDLFVSVHDEVASEGG